MPIVSKHYITFFLGKSANSYVRSPFVGAVFIFIFSCFIGIENVNMISFKCLLVDFRGVFRILSNIYDEDFL